LKCKYIVFGYERGEEGTPHLQGYVHLSTQKTLSAMKKFIPRAHLEPRRGTIDEAVDYCKKDGDFEEYGEKPKTQQEKGVSEKARWKRIFEKAEEGDEEWLKENEPNVAFKHMATFRSHKKPKTEVMDYEETPMNGGMDQLALASRERCGPNTPVIIRKKRTSGGVITWDKIRS